MKFKSAFNKEIGAMRRTGPRAGFTLAEVMAAMVFMAILIPVALEGLSVASRAGEFAVRKSEASLVAERVLNETVVTTNWDRSSQSGTIRQGAREFRWTLRNEPWNQDANVNTMRLLSVDVSFDVQGRDFKVHMSTLIDGASPLTTQSTTQAGAQ